MAGHRVGKKKSKSELRTWIVDQILNAIRGEDIFSTLDYKKKNEAFLKQYMHQPLQRCMLDIVRRVYPKVSPATHAKKAKDALLWEGDVKTNVSHVRFLGVQHRPDFVVEIGELKIAVEVKRGEKGSAIREGIGQSLVYSCSGKFQFVVYLFVDTSKDKRLRNSLQQSADAAFIESLWNEFNVRFAIV